MRDEVIRARAILLEIRSEMEFQTARMRSLAEGLPRFPARGLVAANLRTVASILDGAMQACELPMEFLDEELDG